MFAKQTAEILTIQDKNITSRVVRHNLRPPAKNVRCSKPPGTEAGGRSAVPSLTPEVRSARPDPQREAGGRRPLKLAPLELPEEVREAQRQKLKQGAVADRPRGTKGTSGGRRKMKIAGEPLRTQSRGRPPGPRAGSDGRMEDVVCRGAPAPLCRKPAPPARARPGASGAAVQPESSGRRGRLTRTQCLEEDQCDSNMSGGLWADEGKLARGGAGGGRRPDRQLAGGGDNKPPVCENRSVSKTRREEAAQSAEGGSGEGGGGGGGVKAAASLRRPGRRKPSVTKHDDAPPLEAVQLRPVCRAFRASEVHP